MDIETYQGFGLHRNFGDVRGGDTSVNGRSNGEILDALDVAGDCAYHPCPESLADEPERQSQLLHFDDWRDSSIFEGTTRHVWIVVPDGITDADTPGVAVFNDGGSYLHPGGAVRARRLFESLHIAEEIPPTIGVFVTPGRPLHVDPEASEWAMSRHPDSLRQRSIEYDSLTTDYSNFVVDELVPFVEVELGFALNPDPARRAMVGISSGGICAWTTAWHRPDQFGCVLSHCGSFVNIRGGHQWPYLIRTTERKAIRVFLQSGSGDAEILFGSWPLANQQMAAALAFAGYEHRFEFGTGGHNLRHAGALMADSLRWLLAPS